MRRFFSCVLLAACSVLPLTTSAPAAQPAIQRMHLRVDEERPRLSLSPPQLIIDGQPGKRYRATFLVRNLTPDQFPLVLGAIDLQAGDSPTSLVRPRTGASRDVATWMQLPQPRRMTAASGEQLSVPVIISIPPNASPGLHAGAFVVSRRLSEPAAATDQKSRITVQGNLAAEIFIRVAGDATTSFRLRVEHAPRWVHHGDRPVYSALLTNTGDTLLQASGKLALGTFAGTDAGSYRLSPRSTLVLPDGARRMEARWDDPPFLGWFKPTIFADVNGAPQQLDIQTVFVLPPWWLVALLVAALVLPLVIGQRRRRRHARRDS